MRACGVRSECLWMVLAQCDRKSDVGRSGEAKLGIHDQGAVVQLERGLRLALQQAEFGWRSSDRVVSGVTFRRVQGLSLTRPRL